MQCYESFAARLKVYADLKTIQPRVCFDELILSEIIEEYSDGSIAELNSMNSKRYQQMLNDVLDLMGLPAKIAA